MGRITFPVLRSLSVHGYDLYPGENEGGFEHPFPDGLTVVVGVNGLGKTTLLNLIYRTLVGASDLTSGAERLGRVAHVVRAWQDPSYFSKRVPDRASRAVVRGTFEFGTAILNVERRLDTLELTLLETQAGTEIFTYHPDEYERVVTELCGVGSYYDFLLLQRYVGFFLEDRTPLIWDAVAQFEVLRVLFAVGNSSEHIAALQDQTLSLDSQYRNRRFALNRLRTDLGKKRAARDKARSALQALPNVAGELERIDKRINELASFLGDLEPERVAAATNVELARLELSDARSSMDELQNERIVGLFPRLTDVAHQAFLTYSAGYACLVCGSTDPLIGSRFNADLAERRCPICRSDESEQEYPVRRLENVDEALRRKQQHTLHLEESLKQQVELKRQIDSQYQALLREHNTALAEQRVFRTQYVAATNAASAEGDVARLESELAYFESEVDNLRASLRQTFVEYKSAVDHERTRVEELVGKLTEDFGRFGGELLAEDCSLVYEPVSTRIGEEANYVDLPSFRVAMTSAVFLMPRARSVATEVSESQREFVDLAFRMALLSAASTDESGSMLVIETPEASLDVAFAREAAHLFGMFARSAKSRVLICSSNLVQGEMVGQLLRAARGPDGDVTRHMINLIDIAARNAAVRKYGETYQLAMQTALTIAAAP